MFGGAGVYCDGLMFALVSGGDVYLKCDEGTAGRFRDAGCRPFLYEREGRQIEMSYWSLPEQALDEAGLLKLYADLALEAARRAKRPRRRNKGA